MAFRAKHTPPHHWTPPFLPRIASKIATRGQEKDPLRSSSNNYNQQNDQPDQAEESHNVEPMFQGDDNQIKGTHYHGPGTELAGHDGDLQHLFV